MHEEIAEEIPRQQSYLEFMVNAMGWKYMFLLPLAALVSLALILVLAWRGKGSAVSAALVLLVPLPIVVGVFGVVDGMLASFQVIAMTNTAPKPAAYAQGICMSLTTLFVGLLLALPGYTVAVCATVVRSLLGDAKLGIVRRELSGRPPSKPEAP